MSDEVRRHGRNKTPQRLVQSGLHPHPGPHHNSDIPEAFDEPEGNDDGISQEAGGVLSVAADLGEQITEIVDRCQAPLTSRPDLSEEMRDFIAARTAEATEKKIRIAEEAMAARAAAAMAIETSRLQCQRG